MSNTPRNITRNDLAEFLPNQRAVRAFEQLLKSVGELLPADIAIITQMLQETFIEAANGSSKAQEALDMLSGFVQDLSISLEDANVKSIASLDQIEKLSNLVALLPSAPVPQVGSSLSLDYLDLNPSAPTASEQVGRLKWGPTGTLELSMGGGNIIQQVGEEIFVYGKATAAITEGQLIMVTGALGASGVLTFAPTTTGLTDPNAILGVATENLALNAFGRVTIIGIVHGINTTGSSVGEVWADGDVLWYNPSFVGGMTKVKPSAPNMKTQVAIVINASTGGSGSLQVEVLHGSTLGGTDSNVQLSVLADKQLLQYDSVAGYWKNVAVSSVGSTAAETHAAASKTTPVDADEIPLADSASSFSLKKLTWANLKATLATWIGGNLIAGSFTSLVSSTTAKVATTLGVGNATPSASGAGISFPAAQSASTNANTLDDYEEGEWTPTYICDVSNPTVTYNTAITGGRYVKVGKIVHIYGCIRTTTSSGGSGVLQVGGLPFVCATATAAINTRSAISIGRSSGFNVNNPSGGNTIGGQSYIELWYKTTANGNSVQNTIADLSTTDVNLLILGGSYEAAS